MQALKNNNKLLIISELNKNKIKKFLSKQKNYCCINFEKLNKKSINYEKIVFIINNNLEEIKMLMQKIELLKMNYYINNNKINIIVNKNKRNGISIKILKNILKNYKIMGGKIKCN